MIDFTGKRVLVTGGGVGIGRGIAEAFAQAGAQLFIAEIDPERAADVAAAIPSAEVIVCDVLDRGTPAMLAARIAAAAGRLDVLVNNVGHFVHALPFAMLSGEQADEILDVNLGQLLRMTAAMLPLLREAAPAARSSTSLRSRPIAAFPIAASMPRPRRELRALPRAWRWNSRPKVSG